MSCLFIEHLWMHIGKITSINNINQQTIRRHIHLIFFFTLIDATPFEICLKHNLESFAMNLYIFVALTNKKLFHSL